MHLETLNRSQLVLWGGSLASSFSFSFSPLSPCTGPFAQVVLKLVASRLRLKMTEVSFPSDEVPQSGAWWGDYVIAYLIVTSLLVHCGGLWLLLKRCCWGSSVEVTTTTIVTRAMEGQQYVARPPYLEIRPSRDYPVRDNNTNQAKEGLVGLIRRRRY